MKIKKGLLKYLSFMQGMESMGATIVLAALGWKMAAFPFGVGWPTYAAGLPTPAALVLDGTVRLAASVAAFRFIGALPGPAFHMVRSGILALGAAAAAVGEVGAGWQKSIRGLAAHSGVAWAGWFFLAAVGRSRSGFLTGVWAWTIGTVGAWSLADIMDEGPESPGDAFLSPWFGLPRTGRPWAWAEGRMRHLLVAAV